MFAKPLNCCTKERLLQFFCSFPEKRKDKVELLSTLLLNGAQNVLTGRCDVGARPSVYSVGTDQTSFRYLEKTLSTPENFPSFL